MKDYIEHLRKTHLTLLVVCFALFAGPTFDGNSHLHKAKSDLESVIELADNWDKPWLAENIFDAINDMYKKAIPNGQPFKLKYVIPYVAPLTYRHVYYTAVRLPTALIMMGSELRIGRNTFQVYTGQSSVGPILARIGSIHDFRNLWDTLSAPHYVLIPIELTELSDSHNYIFSPALLERIISVDPLLLSDSSPVVPVLRYSLESERAIFLDFGKMACPYETDGWTDDRRTYTKSICFLGESISSNGRFRGKLLFFAKVKFRCNSIDLRKTIISQFNSSWIRRKFSLAFPELDQATLAYQGINLDDAYDLLKREIDTAENTVQVFGVTLPRDKLVFFGGLIVMLIQLYFLMHLKAFVRVVSQQSGYPIGLKVSPSPWIGLYENLLARLATWLSAVLLPATIVSYLSFPGNFRTASADKLIGFFSCFVITLILAFFLHRYFRKFWAICKTVSETEYRRAGRAG